MARIIDHFVEEPRPCSYLDDRSATLEHRIMLDVSLIETEALLSRGWRRFGPDYFRPVCASCQECVPTRVPTATFQPTKSQRRAMRKCAPLIRRVSIPTFDEERLALYRAWHAFREEKRGWEMATLDERAYRLQFTLPHPAAREITYHDPETGRLVGVALSDETPSAWSAIYFFYDPAWAERSIGTANVVTQIEIARRRNIPHVYLGYYVRACASLTYKGRFNPRERLRAFVGFDEAPLWEEAPLEETPLEATEPTAGDGT